MLPVKMLDTSIPFSIALSIFDQMRQHNIISLIY
jgi:hypothetical protein